jgi:hypothetical protein
MRREVKFHLAGGNTIIFDEPVIIPSSDKLIYDYEYNENNGLIVKHIYLESSTSLKETIEVLSMLLHHLPDSDHDDESWNWCWEQLSGEAQEAVKAAREKGYQLVSELVDKVTKDEGKT